MHRMEIMFYEPNEMNKQTIATYIHCFKHLIRCNGCLWEWFQGVTCNEKVGISNNLIEMCKING